MKAETIILLLAILSTGIMTGVFFTWSNAVTPGIGKLGDMEYLRALQSMNRVILNTAFMLVFVGAVITVALVPILYFKTFPSPIFWLFIASFIIYWAGAFGVTFLGNIPLNTLLDGTNLDVISLEDAKSLRSVIESKWNNLNLIRTITSAVTFLLLVISLAIIDK